ncbi:Arm DNA-binding domain-containing protein [Sphingobium sp. CAP-1]|uniref:Arm DNA-binding domain-containing protein n=1 Tax=Sphingobium sp. CAP-1 TaxID=2676077 RepID=UPI002E319AFD|nr:Arm DNA-binding domain-containing protein [Sphingobium sp. CAP-1]
MGKLSATAVKAATRPGRLGDGDGLFLVIQPGGGKSWMCRVQKNGNRCQSASKRDPRSARKRDPLSRMA